MNIYKNVPEHFHEQYMHTIELLTKADVTNTEIATKSKNSKSTVINGLLRLGYACGAAAAVFVFALILCAANPAMAAKLPIIGNVFTAMQDHFGFGRLPEEGMVVLVPENITDNITTETVSQNDAETTPYQASDNGLTLSIEEYYASNQSIFLGVRIVTEDPLSQDVTDRMMWRTTENYSFRKNDPETDARTVEVQRVDDHTFLGIIRIDYDSIQNDLRKYNEAYREAEEKGTDRPVLSAETWEQYVEYYEIPDTFYMDIQFHDLWVYHTSADADTFRQTIKGTWSIENLPIKQSMEGTTTIQINEVNEAGFGMDRIELSPVELTIYPIEPADHLANAVVLDKDGKIIRSGGSNGYQLAVNGHDVSEITIYMCDYDEYMDEIKGYTLSDDSTELRKVLEDRCLYKKSVKID